MQRLDFRLLISINKKISGFLRASASGMKNPGTLPGFSLSSLLLLFYQIEGNYYANYFSWASGWCGVGYGNFWVRRGLTRDFTEVFGERKCGGGLVMGAEENRQQQKQCGGPSTALRSGRDGGCIWRSGRDDGG
jgi:hypothetical protein